MTLDDSDSDSGLPETVSFFTSASVAKGHNHALRSFHAVEKRKIKERNRRHDERLKAQAIIRHRVTDTTGEGKLYVGNHEVETGDIESGSDLDHHLHRRMTRAMGEAKEEMEESDSASASASAEEWGGINLTSGGDLQAAADQDVEMSSEEAEEGEEMPRNGDLDSGDGEGDDDDDDGGLGALRSQAPTRKYLPDHVFVAAWSKPKPDNEVRQSQTTLKTRDSRKRQLVKAHPKDVVVGTRTVRTLSSSPASAHVQSQRTTLRPARINNFLANALKLQGKSKKIPPRASRWERRPSHLGVMKRTVGAPVTGFARPSQH